MPKYEIRKTGQFWAVFCDGKMLSPGLRSRDRARDNVAAWKRRDEAAHTSR